MQLIKNPTEYRNILRNRFHRLAGYNPYFALWFYSDVTNRVVSADARNGIEEAVACTPDVDSAFVLYRNLYGRKPGQFISTCRFDDCGRPME
jgi:hypothetical protein